MPSTLLHSSASNLTLPKNLALIYQKDVMLSTSQGSRVRRRSVVHPRLRSSANQRVDSTNSYKTRIYLHRESEVSTRPALDQRSTSANESVEEAWRISCAHRVNWLLLHNRKQNY